MKAHFTDERSFINNPQSLLRLVAAIAFAAAPLSVGAQAPIITNMALVPRLTIQSPLGVTNQIQYTNRLGGTNWIVLRSLLVTNSPYVFVDVDAPADAARFYQVVVPPTQVTPFVMVPIQAGSFTMGDTFNEGQPEERPTHSVHVSTFYMDTTEVTKAQWDAVKNWNGGNGYTYDNPGLGKATNHPVHTVSWFDVVKWCNARSQKDGLTPAYYTDAALTVVYKTGQVAPYAKWTANGYRLPTEAEWEKAARGGSSGHRFPWAADDTIAHSRANYFSSTDFSYDTSATRGFHPIYNDGISPYTSPVGSFAPNGYGLYGMADNVLEWCWDWLDWSWYNNALATTSDTRGPASGSDRVARGGSWGGNAIYCRTANRGVRYGPSSHLSTIGFRCVHAAGQ